MLINHKRGDIFFTRSPMWIARVFSKVESFWSPDDRAPYDHCGIIIDEFGTIFESDWSVKTNNLYNEHAGKQILVLRYKEFTDLKFIDAYGHILKHKGQWYPLWRLVLHALRLAKFIHWENVICSELVVQYLDYLTNDLRFRSWYGWNPDDLFDYLENHKDYEIVFNGRI
jgi:hypothetical protein